MIQVTIIIYLLCVSLVDGLSPEMAAMLLACVIGGYTLIGGLGATFYVSYFNTALIFVLILMLVVEVKTDIHFKKYQILLYLINGHMIRCSTIPAVTLITHLAPVTTFMT